MLYCCDSISNSGNIILRKNISAASLQVLTSLTAGSTGSRAAAERLGKGFPSASNNKPALKSALKKPKQKQQEQPRGLMAMPRKAMILKNPNSEVNQKPTAKVNKTVKIAPAIAARY